MTGFANGLEVVIIVSTTTGNVDDVIKLKVATNAVTNLASKLIALEYLIALTSPRSTAASMSPSLFGLMSIIDCFGTDSCEAWA